MNRNAREYLTKLVQADLRESSTEDLEILQADLQYWEPGDFRQIVGDTVRRKLDLRKPILEVVEQHLCERIIDPCGYDPKAETKRELVERVLQLSEDNDRLLKRVRQAISEQEVK